MRFSVMGMPGLFLMLTVVSATAPGTKPAQAETPLNDPIVTTTRSQPQNTRMAAPWTSPLARPSHVTRGEFVSVQVNVDADGQNIPGDRAHEPSIAVDPTAPGVIVIAWRDVSSDDHPLRVGRLATAYSHDGGRSWTYPGLILPTIPYATPTVRADAQGNMYLAVTIFGQPSTDSGGYIVDMLRSVNGGIAWEPPERIAPGAKPWLLIDRTDGPGHGNIYLSFARQWTFGPRSLMFTRSVDQGNYYSNRRVLTPDATITLMDVGLDGSIYLAGASWNANVRVFRSSDAWDRTRTPFVDLETPVDLGGYLYGYASSGPNPDGLTGQPYIAVDRSGGPRHGWVYLLCTVRRNGFDFFKLDTMFARSEDGGQTWTPPIRVSDFPEDANTWHWFGMMSLAPNGRIDVMFNDTRSDPSNNISELYYTFSEDGGDTWSANVPVTPPFDHTVGRPPVFRRIGHYYDMTSDDLGVHVAYAATFNGEQDIYYLRIGPTDCNGNGLPDDEDVLMGRSEDCDGNGFPDECQRDCDGNGIIDVCEPPPGPEEDCNGDGIKDVCQNDFSGNGIINQCDGDIDGDGVPNHLDICDYTPPGQPITPIGHPKGDFDRSCEIDLPDVRDLALCLGAYGGPQRAVPRYCREIYDFNYDDHVDLRDAAMFLNAFGGQ